MGHIGTAERRAQAANIAELERLATQIAELRDRAAEEQQRLLRLPEVLRIVGLQRAKSYLTISPALCAAANRAGYGKDEWMAAGVVARTAYQAPMVMYCPM